MVPDASSNRRAVDLRPQPPLLLGILALAHAHVALHPEPRVMPGALHSGPESWPTLTETPISVANSCGCRHASCVSPPTPSQLPPFKQ